MMTSNEPNAAAAAAEVHADFVASDDASYQRVVVRPPGGESFYVALEAKVFKYAHRLHFAHVSVHRTEGGAVPIMVIDALETLHVDYEGPETVTELGSRALSASTVSCLVPAWLGDVPLVVCRDLAARVPSGMICAARVAAARGSPRVMFDYAFSGPASKTCAIGLVAVPDGSGGQFHDMEHRVLRFDPDDPFGPCTPGVVRA